MTRSDMKAYVINLARSPERRTSIRAQLEDLNAPYEIIQALDGRDLDLNDGRLVDPAFVGERSFRPGIAGCALSHLRVYHKALMDGSRVSLVLEDDAILPADFLPLVVEVADHLRGAEVALLHFHGVGPCRLSTQRSVPLSSSRLLAFPVSLCDLTSTAAYLMTYEACERMARIALPIKRPADDWRHFFEAGALDRVRCIAPRCVRQNRHFRSTMDEFRPGSMQARLREAVVRHRIPPLYQARVWRRGLAGRNWRVELVADPSSQFGRTGGASADGDRAISLASGHSVMPPVQS